MGIEKALFGWILDAANGKRAPKEWRKWPWINDFRNWEPPKRSLNHPVLANLLRLLVDGGPEAVDWWRDFFQREHALFFQDYEFFSRMKNPWVIACVAKVREWARANGERALAQAAARYLRRCWGLCTLMAVPWPSSGQVNRSGRPRRVGPHVAHCGPRSPSSVWHQNQLDDLFAAALDWPRRWTKYRRNWSLELAGELDLALKPGERRLLCQALDVHSKVGYGTAIGLLGNLQTIGRYEILRTDRGLATWTDIHNPHSRPVVGTSHDYESRVTHFVAPEIYRDGGRLLSRGWPPTTYKALRRQVKFTATKGDQTWRGELKLPAGKVLYHLQLGPEGLKRVQ